MNVSDIDDRLSRLIEILIRRTRMGSVHWGQAGTERYELSFDRTSYAISTRDQDDQAPYIFEGYDSAGIEVMRFLTSEVENEEILDAINTLYRMVKSSVDDKGLLAFLNEAIKDVADPDEPPF